MRSIKQKIKKFKFLKSAVFVSALILSIVGLGYFNTQPASAVPPAPCSQKTVDYNAKCDIEQDCTNSDLTQDCQITDVLIKFINILSGIVGVVVVGVMVFSGIQYSTSAGDPQAAAAARKRIINAVLALVFYAMAYGFMQWLVPGGLF